MIFCNLIPDLPCMLVLVSENSLGILFQVRKKLKEIKLSAAIKYYFLVNTLYNCLHCALLVRSHLHGKNSLNIPDVTYGTVRTSGPSFSRRKLRVTCRECGVVWWCTGTAAFGTQTGELWSFSETLGYIGIYVRNR